MRPALPLTRAGSPVLGVASGSTHPSSPLTDGMLPAQIGRTVVHPVTTWMTKLACGGRAQRASSSCARDEHQGGQGGRDLGTRTSKLRHRRSTGCYLGRQTLGFPVHDETVRTGCAGSNNEHAPRCSIRVLVCALTGFICSLALLLAFRLETEIGSRSISDKPWPH